MSNIKLSTNVGINLYNTKSNKSNAINPNML